MGQDGIGRGRAGENANDDGGNRLSASCTKKCIPTEYKEGDLNKGESVCLDRCVSKFFDINIKVRFFFLGGWAVGRVGW